LLARNLNDFVIAEHGLVARFGGEEFVVALPGLPTSKLLEVAERLRLRICAEPARYAGNEITITASIGAFNVPIGFSFNPDDALHQADDALYAAKHGGRNRVCSAALVA